MSIWQIGIVVYVVWNLYGLMLMGFDKHRAQSGGWRIPEGKLLFVGFMFGAVGIFLGMKVFRHKTLHYKFLIGVPVLAGANFVMLYLMLHKWG